MKNHFRILFVSLFTYLHGNAQYTDTLLFRFNDSVFIDIKVNKPNYYNIVKSTRFIPCYVFSNDLEISNSFISFGRDHSTLGREAFLCIEVETEALKLHSKNSNTLKQICDSLKYFIDLNYKTHNYTYALATGDATELLTDIIKCNIAFSDVYTFYFHYEFRKFSDFISQTIKSFSRNNTTKTINIISLGSYTAKKDPKLYFNSVDIYEERVWFDEKVEENVGFHLKRLIEDHSRILCDISFNLFFDDFQSSVTYFEQLEQNLNARTKLVSNRNLNDLAYGAYLWDGDFAIEILNYAINLFPYDLNLYHSKGEIYEKLGRREEAVLCYKILLEKIEIEKPSLESYRYDYWHKKLTVALEKLE